MNQREGRGGRGREGEGGEGGAGWVRGGFGLDHQNSISVLAGYVTFQRGNRRAQVFLSRERRIIIQKFHQLQVTWGFFCSFHSTTSSWNSTSAAAASYSPSLYKPPRFFKGTFSSRLLLLGHQTNHLRDRRGLPRPTTASDDDDDKSKSLLSSFLDPNKKNCLKDPLEIKKTT